MEEHHLPKSSHPRVSNKDLHGGGTSKKSNQIASHCLSPLSPPPLQSDVTRSRGSEVVVWLPPLILWRNRGRESLSSTSNYRARPARRYSLYVTAGGQEIQKSQPVTVSGSGPENRKVLSFIGETPSKSPRHTQN
ncbi:hypothetical protein FKM82_025856 [Ascaphus truei]